MTPPNPLLPPGPIESATLADRLVARIVSPGPIPKVHGYDIEGDLARNYDFAEVTLLALTGQPPELATGRAFNAALLFLLPAPVTEAPTHASVLAALCGAIPSGILGAGTVGLTEQARAEMVRLAGLLSWLDSASGPPPATALASGPEDRESAARLRRLAEEASLVCPALGTDLGRLAAAVAVLHSCGLKRADQIEAVMLIARLPCLAAEAFAARGQSLRDYPLDLPHFEYFEDEEP